MKLQMGRLGFRKEEAGQREGSVRGAKTSPAFCRAFRSLHSKLRAVPEGREVTRPHLGGDV